MQLLMMNYKNGTNHLLIGLGSNGKSSLISLLSTVLGKYAYCLPSQFITGKMPTGATTEFMEMEDKRLIYLNEPEENERINFGRKIYKNQHFL